MEKHILSLIKENNRVIIPNFGAFIIAKENGFTILFNNFLSFNDGLLIDHVVEYDKVTKEEANKLVDDYVDTLKEKLDSEGRYEIKGLGLFTKDASGILRFSQADDINHVDESDETDGSLLDIDTGSDDIIAEESSISGDDKEIDILKETPLVEVENEPEKVEDKTTPSVVKNVQSTSSGTSSQSYLDEDNSKRNRSIFIFSIIIIALIVMAVYFVFFHNRSDEGKKPVNTERVIPKIKEKKIVTEKPKVQDGIVAGPETKKPEKEVKKTVIPKSEPIISKPHHLIVGSFKNKENADKYMGKLRGMGYNKCMAIQSKTMTLISIESFEKVYQAQAKQEELLEKHKMESWVLTKRK